METIDLTKQYKDLYTATAKSKIVDVGPGSFLAVDGQGAPGGDAFQSAIGHIYGVAFTLKFALKGAGTMDFKVAKLEFLYLDDPSQVANPADWHWTALIRVPDEVTQAQVSGAKAQVQEKKRIDVSKVSLRRIAEGRCMQKMHVGPYEKVGYAYAELMADAEAKGLKLAGPGHEIYISDPSRTAPERTKTIVRQQVAG